MKQFGFVFYQNENIDTINMAYRVQCLGTSKFRRCLTQFYTVQMKPHFTDITHYPRISVQTRCVRLFSFADRAHGRWCWSYSVSCFFAGHTVCIIIGRFVASFGLWEIELADFLNFLVVGTFGRGTKPSCGTTSTSNETFSSSLIFSINDSKRGELITLPSLAHLLRVVFKDETSSVKSYCFATLAAIGVGSLVCSAQWARLNFVVADNQWQIEEVLRRQHGVYSSMWPCHDAA